MVNNLSDVSHLSDLLNNNNLVGGSNNILNLINNENINLQYNSNIDNDISNLFINNKDDILQNNRDDTINSQDLYVTESDKQYSDINEEIHIKKINRTKKLFFNYENNTDTENLTDSNLSSIKSD